MIKSIPFEVKGIDSDNGEEFINWHLERYCSETGLKHFRSRPYKKDDQAHIEQKNWTHVRKLIGWDRYDSEEAILAINNLYVKELRILNNFFLYEPAKTPLDRLIENNSGNKHKLVEYVRLRKILNPFEISKIIDKKLEIIWSLSSKTQISSYYSRSPLKRQVISDGNAYSPLISPFRNTQINQFRKQWYKKNYLK